MKRQPALGCNPLYLLFQKESPDVSRQSPANGHASVTSSILVRFSHAATELGKCQITFKYGDMFIVRFSYVDLYLEQK